MPNRDHYLIGKLGSYLCATVPQVDGHLRSLHLRLANPSSLTARQYTNTWHDIDELLDRRLRNMMRVPA